MGFNPFPVIRNIFFRLLYCPNKIQMEFHRFSSILGRAEIL